MVALADFPRQNGVSADDVDRRTRRANQQEQASNGKSAAADRII
jgi:hypothetical protein